MLTKKQKQVLDFIEKYKNKKGYAPSLEEIKKHLKLASVSTAHYHIKKLQERGYLKKEKNQPRGIAVYKKEKMVRVPLLGTIAAGQPIEAVEEKETIAVPQSKLCRSGKFFALQVIGDSMIDENISDGDLVLIKQQSVAENGQKVVALINNCEATLKKFYKERGQIRLQPANKNFTPIIIKKDQEFAIQGIVIDIIRNEKELQCAELLPEKKQKEKKRNNKISLNNVEKIIQEKEKEMAVAAKNLEFELAAVLRDQVKELKNK